MERTRHWLHGLLGIIFGIAVLAFTMRNMSFEEVGAQARQIQFGWIVWAGGAYAMSLAVRVVRWHRLLNEISPSPMRIVAETLIVG